MKSSCSPRRLRGCQKPGEPLSASLILLTRSHSLPKVNLPHQHPVSFSLSFSLPLYLFLPQHLCTSREGKALIMHSSHLIPHSLPNLPHFPSVPRIPPHFTRTLHPSIFMIPNNLLPSLILLISSYVFHLKLFNNSRWNIWICWWYWINRRTQHDKADKPITEFLLYPKTSRLLIKKSCLLFYFLSSPREKHMFKLGMDNIVI